MSSVYVECKLTLTSPVRLSTDPLKPQVCHYSRRCHLGFSETEGTIFGKEGAAGEDMPFGSDLEPEAKLWYRLVNHTVAMP